MFGCMRACACDRVCLCLRMSARVRANEQLIHSNHHQGQIPFHWRSISRRGE